MMFFNRVNRILGTKAGIICLFFLLSASFCFAAEKNGKITFEKDNGIVTFFVDGAFYAQYRSDFKGTPIIWPICSADGTLMSRGYPMDQTDDPALEKTAETKNIRLNSRLDSLTANKDHIHQRSLWFTHGLVNNFDFWGPDLGTVVETELISLASDSENAATIKTKNVWIPEKGAAPLCEDIRTVTFGADPADPNLRYIDYDIQLTALTDEVVFGDTKEGTFGFRTAGSTDVEASKRSGKWGGHILNNAGDKDEEAWGKRASWVDYYGPAPKRLSDAELAKTSETMNPEDLELTSAGVVIMNHPKSFRYPSWYHVRTYGLFAVNPFGLRDFEPNARFDGSVTLTKGDKLSLNYRVLFHDQPLTAEKLNELFENYKAVPKAID